MLGPIFVFGLLALICVKSLKDPAFGVIGYYGFVTLDPTWNWRWSLPQGFEYQNYIVVAIATGCLLNGFKTNALSGQTKMGLAAATAFYIWCWVCASQSIDPSRSAWFMSYLWKVLLMFGVAILTINTPKKLLLFMVVACVGQTYNAYQINLDYFQTGYSRFAYSDWGSKGVDNNGYQLITIPIMAIATSCFLLSKTNRYKLMFAAFTLLMIHQILLSFSRGAWVGCIAFAICVIYYLPHARSNHQYLGAIFLTGFLLAGPSVAEEFKTIFAAEEDRDSSAESRMHLWRAGWMITADHPIFGTGPGASRRLVATEKYYAGNERSAQKALHNLFFDVSSETGIPGFLCFMIIFCAPLTWCFRSFSRNHPYNACSVAALAYVIGLPSYFVASCFSSGALFETSYILVIAAYAATNIGHFDDRVREPLG